MCGIVGLLASSADPGPLPSWVRGMAEVISHRGPDDEGFYEDGNIVLGTRRLSIIDLTTGRQPMATTSGRYWITFNGEIYNFRELRSKLEKLGHRFATESDTEVVVQGFEAWGPKVTDHLNGMFAFAIWDTLTRDLFLARDRMGIKPLYYTQAQGLFGFASEVKALLRVPILQREIDDQALWDYLSYRYVPGPDTLFRGIRKLPPGRYMTCSSDGRVEVEQYWSAGYPEAVDSERAPSQTVEQEFEELFIDSVRKRLVADVPVGILLSGGLDSTAVTAATREIGGSPTSTFSIGFSDGGMYDETKKARKVAEHFGTDHHEIVIGKQEFSDFLLDFPYHTDEPIADLASIPLYYVSRLASDHVKVVLSGEGSDEVLGGYRFDSLQRHLDWAGRVRLLRAVLPANGVPSWASRPMPARMRRGVKLATLGPQRYLADEPVEMTLPLYFSEVEKAKLLGLNGSLPSRRIADARYRQVEHAEPLHQLLFTISHEWLAEDLLMKADKMTMANSLELRVPFLDHRLVEWLARQPASVKVHRDENGRYSTKYLLRRFLASRAPAETINQPKLGFSVPAYHWLVTDSNFAEDVLFDPDGFVRERCDEAQVRSLLETRESLPTQHRLWALIVLSLWYAAYFSKQSVGSPTPSR